VVGASGAGKSLFTGLVLKRLLDRERISVLFIDHNRSFKRVCLAFGAFYLEPENLDELKKCSLAPLDRPHVMAGVELSELLLHDKKVAAAYLLEEIEKFLRHRRSDHILYVVLDECWNFLRDEPVRVQRAYREYRKLFGAVVSLSHGLTDFLNTENGQSILQNAPVRILLRQGEDMLPLQSVLGLNSVELREARLLRQKRGEYSECLIKTPFSSEIARLYPTPEEYELLRTDNLRSAQ
jgi:type IV secretory pathway VirB4 component